MLQENLVFYGQGNRSGELVCTCIVPLKARVLGTSGLVVRGLGDLEAQV